LACVATPQRPTHFSNTMNVVHVVLFDLKADKQQVLAEVEPMLRRMRREIPGLIELHFGARQSMYEGYVDRSQGYNFALASRHLSPAAVQTYADHPAHVKLATYLKSQSKRPALAVDFPASSQGAAKL
jgi:hypothetical protein